MEGSAFADIGKQAGVDPTGVAECATAIQTALDGFVALGLRAYAKGTFKISSTVTIKDHADFSDAIFNYDGTGTAVQLGQATQTRRKRVVLPQVVYTPKGAVGWTAGTVGVRVVNMDASQISVPHITNFEKGLVVYGQSASACYSTYHMGGLNNNKVNLSLEADADGYVNQNTFIGGQYSHNSGEGTQVVGCKHIYLSDILTSRPNANVWVGASLESPNVVEYAVDVESGQYNRWLNCRFEDTSGSPRFRWGPKAVQNEVSGGYLADAIVFTKASGASRNSLLTADRFEMGGATTPTWRVANESSSGSLALGVYGAGVFSTAYTPANDWTIGIASTFIKVKNKTDSFERVRIDQAGGGAGGGLAFGSGSAEADVTLYRSAANVLKTDDKLVVALDLEVDGRLNVTPRTPTGSADATGTTGDIAADDNYVYVKTSTGWKRAALAAW